MPDVIKPQLLDEESLRAIKKYVDDGDAQAGKVDDVKIQVGSGTATSIVSNKIATIPVTSSYSGTSETIVNGKAIKAALDGLTDTLTGTPGAGKTITAFDEVGGKVTATFGDIQITESQVTNLTTDLAGKVPTSRTVNGKALSANITIYGTDVSASSSISTKLIDSNGKIPTSLLPESVTSGMEYKGTWNASTASGTISGLEKGWFYICSVAGSKNPDGTAGPSDGYAVGDWAVYNGATDKWAKIDNDGKVQGVKGSAETDYRTGTVNLTPANLGISATTTSVTVGDTTFNKYTHPAGSGASKSSGFYKFSTDSTSHISGVTAVAKSDLTGLGVADDNLVVHKGTHSSYADEEVYGKKSFGNSIEIGAWNSAAGPSSTGAFLAEGTISSTSLVSLDITSSHDLNLSANGISGIATSGFSFKDYYKPSGSSTTYTSSYRFPDKTAGNKSYVIATTDDLTGFVTGPSSSTANHIATFSDGNGKTIKDGGLYLTSASGSATTLYTDNSTLVVTGGPAGGSALGLSIYCSSSGQEVTPASKYDGSSSFSCSYLGTSSKPWTNLYLSGNLSDGTHSTTISALTSHLNNTTVHITSAERTAWNGKVSDVRTLKVEGATDDDDYYKLQQSKDSGSSYTDVAKTLSYNEAYAILTATA